jgi:acyl dehydratase
VGSYPYHVDPVAALDTPFRGLAASGAHTIAIYYRLLYELSQKQQEPLVAIAALGFELKLPYPVRPGHRLTLRTQPIEKRDSKSHPEAGVARTQGLLINQDGRVVLELTAAYLFAKRPA